MVDAWLVDWLNQDDMVWCGVIIEPLDLLIENNSNVNVNVNIIASVNISQGNQSVLHV